MSKTISQLAAFAGVLVGSELFEIEDTTSKKASAFQLRQRTVHRIVGRYYPMGDRPTIASGALAANTCYFVPVWLDEKVTISELACRIGTNVSAGKVGLALYLPDAVTSMPTGLPVAQVMDLDTTTAAAVTKAITGGDKTLTPGLYWMASLADATAGGTLTLQTFSSAAGVGWMVGSATLANVLSAAGTSYLGYRIAMTYLTGFADVTAGGFTEQTGATGALLAYKVSAVF